MNVKRMTEKEKKNEGGKLLLAFTAIWSVIQIEQNASGKKLRLTFSDFGNLT